MSASPLVSIILPTYNRAQFLPEAMSAIRAQSWTDWELVVVDDGSSDQTRSMVSELTADLPQPAKYIYQENQGAYAARNVGLTHSTGKYIAFYDSDDLWRPNHLQDCVLALEQHPDVDWVYGACRVVDGPSGRELEPSTFYVDGEPRQFMRLHSRDSGGLRIIDDPNVLVCIIQHGLYNGLQNSLIRRSVFEENSFDASARNGEDQLFVIQCQRSGCRFAYWDAVHVDYRIHSENCSAAGSAVDFDRKRRVLQALVAGYERMLQGYAWPPTVRRAFHQRLQRDYFWKLGYATLWNSGHYQEAMQMFQKGLHHWPWDWRCWKTYLLSRLCLSLRSAKGRAL